MTELPFSEEQLQYFVSTLDEEDRPKILNHLLRLDLDDRYLRFFASLNDHSLQKYVYEFMDLDKGRGFGLFTIPDRKLIAFAHVSRTEQSDHLVKAEIGVSVDKEFRGKGLAKRLMDRVLVHCKANGINTLFMSCLRENKAMQNIARKAGLKLVLDAGEAFAELEFSEDEKVASMSHEIAYQQITVFDKAYRNNKVLVNELFKVRT